MALHNPREVYGLLMRATAETLLEVAADPDHLGAEVGVLAVLHTWGQNLTLHPHVHCVVTGGGLSLDGSHWDGGLVVQKGTHEQLLADPDGLYRRLCVAQFGEQPLAHLDRRPVATPHRPPLAEVRGMRRKRSSA